MIAVSDVQRIVGTFYGIRRVDLLGPEKSQPLARQRQIAMVMCREFSPASLTRIGNQFGGRDHTTVLHAVKRIASRFEVCPATAANVTKIRALLREASCENTARMMGETAWAEFEGRA